MPIRCKPISAAMAPLIPRRPNYSYIAIFSPDAPLAPRHVTCKTNRLKYGKIYWVSIDRLQRSNEFATLDAAISGNTVSVTTTNVLQYTLSLDAAPLDPRQPVTIISDGLTGYYGPRRSVTLYASLSGSGAVHNWSERDTLPGGLRKTAALEGPIGDAYTSKFIVAYGTCESGVDTDENKTEANTFCRNWNKWMGGATGARPDSSITSADIRDSNIASSSAPRRAMPSCGSSRRHCRFR